MRQLYYILILLMFGCSKSPTSVNDDIPSNVEEPIITPVNLEGVFEKGPYLSGTKIDLLELNENLTQTGKNYSTTITDNKGSYEFEGITLSTNFVELNGLGYYFNEVLGINSQSQLLLSAYHQKDTGQNSNVNILTTLEKQRVRYLISQGLGFIDAKKQAFLELLQVFNIDEEVDLISEDLNLIDGDGSGILLSISSIIQGYRTDAEVNEIISNIATDLKEDGNLNSEITGSKLLSHAIFLNEEKIRNGLITKYSEMGDQIEIPSFENYLSKFIADSSFEPNHLPIEYPEFNDNQSRINVLHLDTEEVVISSSYTGFTLKANFEVDGGLKIRISSTDPDPYVGWYYAIGTNKNITAYEPTVWEQGNKEQYFETPVQSKGLSTDISLTFEKGNYRIDYYELGSDSPTRTKEYKVIIEQ